MSEMFEKMRELIYTLNKIDSKDNVLITYEEEQGDYFSFTLEGKAERSNIKEAFRFKYDFDISAIQAQIYNFIKKLDLIIEFEKQD